MTAEIVTEQETIGRPHCRVCGLVILDTELSTEEMSWGIPTGTYRHRDAKCPWYRFSQDDTQ